MDYFSMQFWLIQTLNSLALGGLLFLLSAGFSLIFGLLREWRGSLIAPMVAHFLHNTTLNVEEFVPVYLLN